jgi:hypothetical protein
LNTLTSVCLLLLAAIGAVAAEPNLDDLQRRLDAAKRDQQKAVPPPVQKPASPRQSTLIVRADSACRLTLDGKLMGELGAFETRSLSVAPGEALVECQSVAEASARYATAYKFEAGTKVVLQIELQEKVLGAKRTRAAPVASPASAATSSAPPPTAQSRPVQAPAPAPSVAAQVSPSTPRAVKSCGPPGLRELGRLVITDRFRQKTIIDVQPAAVGARQYTSGDRLDANCQALAVRIGTHVGVVEKGALWTFPLVRGSAGKAIVNFDSGEVAGDIRWRVEDGSGETIVLVADVTIPFFYSIAHSYLRGTWKAEFDATYPIPARSTFVAHSSASNKSESTVTSWTARPL